LSAVQSPRAHLIGAGRAPAACAACAALVLAATACGEVHAPILDAATDAARDAAAPDAGVDAGVDAPEFVLDRSCADIKARLGTTTDDVYLIDPDREATDLRPFAVFCAGMNTPAPREYLELAHRSPPSGTPTANFATYAGGSVHGEFLCPCGVIAMVFTRIRVNPANLVVDVEDRTSAIFTSSTDTTCLQQNTNVCQQSAYPTVASYGVARSCMTGDTSSGRANIDLREMPFHIAGAGIAMFMAEGSAGDGMVMLDGLRKQAVIQGGGDCGGFGAGAGLRLAQDP
jgi:hypothetical protein